MLRALEVTPLRLSLSVFETLNAFFSKQDFFNLRMKSHSSKYSLLMQKAVKNSEKLHLFRTCKKIIICTLMVNSMSFFLEII